MPSGGSAIDWSAARAVQIDANGIQWSWGELSNPLVGRKVRDLHEAAKGRSGEAVQR